MHPCKIEPGPRVCPSALRPTEHLVCTSRMNMVCTTCQHTFEDSGSCMCTRASLLVCFVSTYYDVYSRRRCFVSSARRRTLAVHGISIVCGHACLAPPEAPQLVQEGGRVLEEEALKLRSREKQTFEQPGGGGGGSAQHRKARHTAGQHQRPCAHVCEIGTAFNSTERTGMRATCRGPMPRSTRRAQNKNNAGTKHKPKPEIIGRSPEKQTETKNSPKQKNTGIHRAG